MTKSEILQWLDEAQGQWQTVLDEVGPARMAQPGVNGDWTMKDIVAHLAGWNRHLLNRFAAALRGEAEPPPPWPVELETDDAINAWIYESNRERSAQELLDESAQINQQIYALVETLPATVRLERVDPAYYLVWVGDERFLPGEFYDHLRDDHEPDVRNWLAKEEK